MIVHFEEGDPENPLNFSKPRKWVIVSRCEQERARRARFCALETSLEVLTLLSGS